jgi:uncharacterized membrane protein YhaH (DUF805 family)
MNWYIEVIKKYAVFEGRARRKEYWYFILINVLISFALTFVDGLTGTLNPEIGYGLLSGIYTLAILLPSISVTVRRLHDTNRSGWWFFIVLIPILGAIALLIFLVLDGKSETNRHGINPKSIEV